MSDQIKRPESIGQAWRQMIQLQERIAELEAEVDEIHATGGTSYIRLQKCQADNERLREFLERGGIDSSAVLAGEDDGTWRDDNERLRAALEGAKDRELKQVRELHKLWKAIPIVIAHVRNHRWESALAELEALKGAER